MEKIKHNRMNNQGSMYIFMVLITSIPTIAGILNISTVGPIRSDIDTMTEGPKYYNMTNLYETLLKKYDIRVRPRKDLSNAVYVSGSFVLQGVFDLDTATQRLSILGYFTASWKDEFLVWNTSFYGGIKEIKLPVGQIWVPPLRLSLTHEGKGKIGDPDDVVIIKSDGQTWLTTDNTYNLICDVDIRYYPFDTQNCEFYVFVPIRNTAEIDITNFTARLSSQYFEQNAEWKTIRIRSVKRVYSAFAMVYINLELERRYTFILYTTVYPLVFLSVLNVGVFLVPVDSGEKGSIAVTIFLSYGVFITTISDKLPPNSLDIAYIITYIFLLLLLSVLAVVYSYIESYLYSRYANTRVYIRFLRRLLNCHKESDRAVKSQTDPVDKHPSPGLTNEKFTPESDQPTWNVLLNRIDTFVFAIMFVITIIATPTFFAFLSSGSNA